jgi:hypothetical protein
VQFYFLGYNAVQSVESQPKFRKNMSPVVLATCFMLVSCVASSTLKMEAVYFPETSADFERATRRYIQKTELCITSKSRAI